MDAVPFVRMQNISKTYPGVKALDGVSLEIRRGEIHALVGENGAGKSTLIKILAGVLKPDPGGSFEIEGRPVELRNALDANRRGISVNYQDISLFPNLTVAENITLGRDAAGWLSRVKWKDVRRRAQQALARLGVELDLAAPLEELSIARQQLVSIARALSFDAKLIVLDEPTSTLSAGEIRHLFQVIRELRESGISILFVSHKMDELFAIAERFTVLRDGRFVGCYGREELDEARLISLMVGREVRYHRENRPDREWGGVVLEVKGLSKQGHFKDIHFSVRAGEILGLTGLVGAGRTELAHALFGLTRPDAGEIRLGGRPLRLKSPRDAVRHGIAYVPESRQLQGLVLNQSVKHNLSLAVLRRMMNRLRLLEPKREAELARDSIARLGIRPGRPEMQAGQLSGGNQQKVVVAKWLAASPKLLIVDEPTNGVDVGAKAEIHRLLRELAASGIAILLISSELPEVLAVSHRILVMRRGRLVGEFDGAQATQEAIMEKALMGEPAGAAPKGADAG